MYNTYTTISVCVYMLFVYCPDFSGVGIEQRLSRTLKMSWLKFWAHDQTKFGM